MLKKVLLKKEFEALFREHYEELFVRALSLLDNEEEAHDAVHEAFARLWKCFQRLDPPGRRAFLYTTVRNLCIDGLRRRKIIKRYQEWWLQTVPENGDAETEEQEERLRKVEEVIEKLPVLTQQILEASFFRQRTYREAGQELGVSEGTVKYHLRNALKIVRAKVQENR